MQLPRIAFAFMLIMALVPALSVTPSNVSGQGYVTITTQTTVLTISTSYNTLTTARNSSIYPATAIVFVKAVPPVGGWEEELRFSANKGDTVYANLTSNIPVTFMVLTDADHAKWVAAHYPCFCSDPFHEGFKTFAPLVLKIEVLSSAVKFLIPSEGTYWFMFFNYSSSNGATINLNAATSHLAITAVPSSTSSSLITEPLTLTTLTTTVNLQVGLPFGNLGVLALVVAVAVIAGVLVIARRKKTSVAATLVQERPATAQESLREAVAPQSVTPTKTTQPVISEIPPIISTGYVDLDKAMNGGIPEEFAVVFVSPSFVERDLLLW